MADFGGVIDFVVASSWNLEFELGNENAGREWLDWANKGERTTNHLCGPIKLCPINA